MFSSATGTRHTQDGRVQRRLQNTQLVLDAAMELGAERQADASPRAVAERAGVSLRSLYRFSPKPELMLLAVLHNETEHNKHLFSNPDAGAGEIEERVAAFVDRRLQLHVVMTPLTFLRPSSPPSCSRWPRKSLTMHCCPSTS